ncbi:hypothetical protein [Streptomyces sp. NPDC053560]|uniref:hypothetical protein n=1 Tax=Streptomyces sp. NPDC053560 TaxID=3365711 RepID=UPI0037D7162F
MDSKFHRFGGVLGLHRPAGHIVATRFPVANPLRTSRAETRQHLTDMCGTFENLKAFTFLQLVQHHRGDLLSVVSRWAGLVGNHGRPIGEQQFLQRQTQKPPRPSLRTTSLPAVVAAISTISTVCPS